MSIKINTNNNDIGIIEYVSSLINKKIELGQNVLWFVSGGSAVNAEVMISKRIKENFTGKLVVTLIDERYGEVGHSDSNWQALIENGFKVSMLQKISVLKGKNFLDTIKDFDQVLKSEFNNFDFKIGIFGVGVDGHTAGILPHSEVFNNQNDLVCGYETLLYNRITITPKAIYKLDEAILYAMGEKKWSIIKRINEDLPVQDFPYQLLKKVPLLTIFTDYKK